MGPFALPNMSNLDTRQNGNEPSSSFGSTGSGYGSDDSILPGFENNPSSPPKSQDAPADGLQMDRAARPHPSHDSSDSSSSEDEEYEPDPYHSSMGNTRANRWRGRRPTGDWKSRARKIDFFKSKCIEKKIPPYSDPSGQRYGQLAFPLGRLKDENGNIIQDKIECYKRVVVWRKLTPSQQQRELDQVEREKRQQEKEKRARDTADKRNKNKREKRRKKREDAATLAGNEQGDDDGSVTAAAVGSQVSTVF